MGWDLRLVRWADPLVFAESRANRGLKAYFGNPLPSQPRRYVKQIGYILVTERLSRRSQLISVPACKRGMQKNVETTHSWNHRRSRAFDRMVGLSSSRIV